MSNSEKPDKKWRRGGRVLLIISLAANLFLVGLMAGGWASGFRFRGPIASNFMRHNMAPDLRIRQLARQLPDATRLKLHEAMTGTRENNPSVMRHMRQSRIEVFQALQAEPFDVARFEDALKRSRQAELARRELSHQVLLTFLDSLDEQERVFVVRMVGATFERRLDAGPSARPRNWNKFQRSDMHSGDRQRQNSTESDAPAEDE